MRNRLRPLEPFRTIGRGGGGATPGPSYARTKLGSATYDSTGIINTTHTVTGMPAVTEAGTVVVFIMTRSGDPSSLSIYGKTVDLTSGSVDPQLKGQQRPGGGGMGFLIELDITTPSSANAVFTLAGSSNCWIAMDVWRFNEATLVYNSPALGQQFIVNANPAITGGDINTLAGDDVLYFVGSRLDDNATDSHDWTSPTGVTEVTDIAAIVATAPTAGGPRIFTGTATGVGAATPYNLGVTATGHGNDFFFFAGIASRPSA